uniref:Uncharacterized protein n=1 Tax=Octopus bimaculoides TaxID=37653 RepID=A0A0L8H9N4_OCTBM
MVEVTEVVWSEQFILLFATQNKNCTATGYCLIHTCIPWKSTGYCASFPMASLFYHCLSFVKHLKYFRISWYAPCLVVVHVIYSLNHIFYYC